MAGHEPAWAPCSPLRLRCPPAARARAEPLPLLRDAAPHERQALFRSKLHLCAFCFDFTDPSAHVREKEMKRQALLELVDYVNSGSGKFTEAVSAARPGRAGPGRAVGWDGLAVAGGGACGWLERWVPCERLPRAVQQRLDAAGSGCSGSIFWLARRGWLLAAGPGGSNPC